MATQRSRATTGTRPKKGRKVAASSSSARSAGGRNGRAHQPSVLRARYDAAQTTSENRRHWAWADQLSAGGAASASVRRLLRSRSRYEIANNAYARGIVQTLANYVVGTGPSLQVQTGNEDVDRFVEREFTRWAVKVGLAELLLLMRKAKAGDGEVFLLETTDATIGSRVKLRPRLVEADRVAAPAGQFADARPDYVDGIHYDADENPTAYDVLHYHPGDPRGFNLAAQRDYDTIPASKVVHYFTADRPGQGRGIPEITPALPLFALLRRYTLAVLGAAETAALFGGAIETDAPADPDPDPDAEEVTPYSWDEIELARDMFTTLPAGSKLTQLKAEQPTTVYPDFKREILSEISRCIDMPLNIAAANSSKFNFASGRLDHLGFMRRVRGDRRELERQVLDRAFDWWFREAVLISNYLPQRLRMRDVDLSHEWLWTDLDDHGDPLKAAKARDTDLKNGSLTYAEVYGRRGMDWRVQFAQRGKEKRAAAEEGIELPSSSGDGLGAEAFAMQVLARCKTDEEFEACGGALRILIPLMELKQAGLMPGGNGGQ